MLIVSDAGSVSAGAASSAADFVAFYTTQSNTATSGNVVWWKLTNSSTSDGTGARIRCAAGNAACLVDLRCTYDTTAADSYSALQWLHGTGSAFYFISDNYGDAVGKISGSGAWQVGGSAFTGQHTIYGTVALNQGDLDSTAMELRGSEEEALVRIRGGGTNSSNGLELTFIGSSTDSTRRFEIGDIDSTIASFKGNGTVYNYANSTAWNTTSDSRVKTNIREISSGLDKILRLHPVHFEYIHKPGKTKTSFIAQEFEQVLPNHIVESSCPNEIAEVLPELKGKLIKGLDCDLHPYLVKAIQELKAENDQLEARIELFERRIKH
jgi:hypothetical protein